MKKNNLTQFIDGNYIQFPAEYFATSKQNIQKLVQAQTVHEHHALRCIIEIGKTLSHLYDFKKRSKSPRIDKMWEELVAEFHYSPSTVTKYIKISKNPVIADERFKNRIPSSVYSLYKLSKIEPIALQLLIESNEVTNSSGRTEIDALTSPVKIKKKTKIQIPIMTLSIDKKDWISSYKSFDDDLIDFLKTRNISYSLSPQVKSIDKSEETRFKKIEHFVFQQSKTLFNKVVKNYINRECVTKNLCTSKTSFKRKIQLMKYDKEEVTTDGCMTANEVQERLLILGFLEESIWNEYRMKWTAEAFAKFPSRIPVSVDTNITDGWNDYFEQKLSKNFTPVKKKREFTGFKV